MADYSLNSINISPAEFLGAFFEPAETVCIRVFSDRPGSAFAGLKLDCKKERFESIIEKLRKQNGQNRGI